MAEGVHPLPVLVERFLPLCPRVHEILDKLRESHIISFLSGFRLRVEPVLADDFGSVAFVEGSVVPACEFVSVGRHQPLEGFPHKDELEVGAKALVDLRDRELGKRAEVTCDVGLVCRDGEGVGVAAVTGEDHEDTLPVSAGYL